MQAQNKLPENLFAMFVDTFNDVDWYYEYIENTQAWSMAAKKFNHAVSKLMLLSDSDLERFIELKVPSDIREKLRTEVVKAQGKFTDDFKYKKLTKEPEWKE